VLIAEGVAQLNLAVAHVQTGVTNQLTRPAFDDRPKAKSVEVLVLDVLAQHHLRVFETTHHAAAHPTHHTLIAVDAMGGRHV
jgi:hypothetical protein